MKVADLPNIGKVLAKELAIVGITEYEALAAAGSAGALYLIKGDSSKGCINMLYALEGAIKMTRWHNLTKEEREEAKRQLQEMLGGK